MGLFKKVKDILFDEEEYTEQIKITPEMRNEPVKEEKKEVKVEAKPQIPKEEPKVQSEKEVFKNNSFPFLDFDEEEFDSSKPSIPKEEPAQPVRTQKRYSNVLEYETKKKMQKRENFGRYEKIETTETIERKKFKPSPIISPVYGVLDRDYKKEDIQKYESKVDVQKVRDKAFGETKEKPISSTIYEQSETVTLSKPTETAEKIKTIDELLEDTSDVVIDMDNDFNKYKVIILPDLIKIPTELKLKLDDFIKHGGKLLATGKSGLYTDKDSFAFDFGIKYIGENPYNPDYFKPCFEMNGLFDSSYVIYSKGEKTD